MRFNYRYKDLSSALSLIALDISAFYLSFSFAYVIRKFLNTIFPKLIPLEFSLLYFFQFWWMPVIFLAFIAHERLYIKRVSFWDEARELIRALIIAIVIILAFVTIGKISDKISRLTLLLLLCCSVFIFPAIRLIGKKVLYKIGLWKENLIIIGAGNAGIEIAKGINNDRHLGYNIIGFLDDDADKIGNEIEIGNNKYKIFGKIKNFKKFLNILNISTVIIAVPSLSIERLSKLTSNIQKYTERIMLVPDLKGIALVNTELYHLFMQQLFLLKIKNNLKSGFNRFIKRTFDISISLFFLPLILIIVGILGLLIKMDSRGHIFYFQTRVGRNGEVFRIFKFRSMYIDAEERLKKIIGSLPAAKEEWENNFKLKNDPRVTRMGRFLRETSLDELPQIFNVLKGEMSLVGPRPVIKEEIDKYYKEYADYYYIVRPGMTGLWQVSGRSNTGYDLRVKLDTWYVLNWSLWLDTVMLFKTIKVVFKKEGAY